MLLTELENVQQEEFIISVSENKLIFPLGTLVFGVSDPNFGKSSNVIFVDREKLKYPLSVRKWQEGDYFYPFGMKGKKKLSKYLKDEKLSIIDKEHIWVLCSGKDIVWVVGKRADDRFKVTETSSQILKIKLQK